MVLGRPRMGEPGGLPPMGSHRVGHNWSDLAAAAGSFPVSQFFTSGGQSTEVSASASVFPMNSRDWSPSEWTGWISLQSKGLSRVFSNTTISKAFILQHSAFFIVQLSHPYLTTGKTESSMHLFKLTFKSKWLILYDFLKAGLDRR